MVDYSTILEIIEKKPIISFTGGGGKTSFMLFLAQKLKLLKKRVLITTTTKLYHPSSFNYFQDYTISSNDELLNHKPAESTITFFYHPYSNVKVSGPNSSFIDMLSKKHVYDAVLIEADGSNQRPVKIPGSGEPVIPESTDLCFAVAGLSSLNRTADDSTIHRINEYNTFFKKSSDEESDTIDINMLCSFFLSPRGPFKTSKKDVVKIAVFNQSDTVTIPLPILNGLLNKLLNKLLNEQISVSLNNNHTICISGYLITHMKPEAAVDHIHFF